MLLIAFFISAIFDTNKDYAQRYGVPESHVYILPKPTDCDWFRAPIGNKECHYEKQVIAEHVPQSGETTENIKKVTDVLVTWEKKED